MTRPEKLYVLGVIPARGGSKGIPRKNLCRLVDKPLIAWTIEAALEAPFLSRIIVSSEDEEILAVARDFGAETPFVRPMHLATDNAASLGVMQHAIEEVERDMDGTVDAVCMLQPTCPLRTAGDIDDGIRKLVDTGCDSVVSVVQVGAHHPLRMKRIIDGDVLVNYVEQDFENMKPRQELPPVFIREGSLYIARRHLVMDHGTLVGGNVRALVISPERTVNIDEPWDLERAERMIADRTKDAGTSDRA